MISIKGSRNTSVPCTFSRTSISRCPRAGRGGPGPVRIGQVHPVSNDQPPRTHRQRRIRIEGTLLPSEGKDLAALRADVGMVFQSFNLFAHKTILDNVTLAPIKVRKKSKADATKRALELLDRVGIASQKDKYPTAVRWSAAACGHRALALWNRRSCCSTSRRRPSTPRWSTRSSTSWCRWPRRA